MTPDLPVHCQSCACGLAAAQSGSSCPFVPLEQVRGACLFREGDPAERVWFVRRGTVVLSRSEGTAAEPRARAVRRDGAFVGLEALVHTRYRDTARTTERTHACVAPLAAVDGWLGAAGTPARTALEQVLRMDAEEPLHAASPDGTARQRVARWIQRDGGEARPLPRQDVAGLLGMAPETFSRALAELGRAGAISTTRRHVTVRDAQVLRRVAEAG